MLKGLKTLESLNSPGSGLKITNSKCNSHMNACRETNTTSNSKELAKT